MAGKNTASGSELDALVLVNFSLLMDAIGSPLLLKLTLACVYSYGHEYLRSSKHFTAYNLNKWIPKIAKLRALFINHDGLVGDYRAARTCNIGKRAIQVKNCMGILALIASEKCDVGGIRKYDYY